MFKALRSNWKDFRQLLRARRNIVAVWPKWIYKRTFAKVRCLNRWMFILNEPAAVQQVMVTNAKNYRKSPNNTQILGPLLGQGLFVSEGELWTRQRRLSNPATHHSRLQGYSAIIAESAAEFLADWQQRGRHEEDITHSFTILTAEIISRIMFGYRLGASGQTLYDAFVEYQSSHGRMHLIEFLGLPSWIPRPGQRRGRRAVEKFDRVLAEILAAGRAANGGETPENFLHLLLSWRDEQGQPMDPALVRDEMASIFLAGHETTAITLGWAFWLMEKHPEVEARVHEEIERVLGSRAPAFEDVPKLAYTRAVIDETLRLYPPVHAFTRVAIGPDVIGDHPIPAGSFITIASWVLHRHTLLWDEPEAFRPERFLPGAAREVQPYAYIPFGAGGRICLGKHLGLLESTLLLAVIAQSYRLRLRPGHPVEPVGRMTLRPSHGLPMVIEARN